MRFLRNVLRPPTWFQISWVSGLSLVGLPDPTIRATDLVDSSWILGLTLAERQHLAWGHDVIWTFGPFGYLTLPDSLFEREWALAILFGVAVHVALVIALLAFLRVSGVGLAIWLVVGALLLVPSRAIFTPDHEAVVLGVLLLYLSFALAERARSGLLIAAAGGGLLGVLALNKGTSAPIGVLLIAIWVVCQAMAGRRWPAVVAPVAFVISLIGAWLLAGQSLDGISDYLRGVYELTAGYSAAMGINGGSGLAVVAFLMVIGFLAAAVVAFLEKDRPLFTLLALSVPVVAVEFKEGFVRRDSGHTYIFLTVVLVLLSLLLIESLRASLIRRAVRLWLIPVVTLAISIVLVNIFLLDPNFATPHFRSKAVAYVQAARLIASPAARRNDAESRARTFRAHYQISDAMLSELRSGTVDVFPWDIDLVYAYNLRWDPHPVLQAYSAYTSYLDQVDAAHLAGAAAADHVVAAYASIDGRYPLFDEPAVIQALMTWYRLPGEPNGGYLMLDRRSGPALTGWEPVGRTCSSLGAVITVPPAEGRFVFATIDVAYSPQGRLLDTLFKPAELRIHLEHRGQTSDYRFIAAVARDGVLISDYVGDVADFASIMRGLRTQPVSAFNITTGRPSDYTGQVCASFFVVSPR